MSLFRSVSRRFALVPKLNPNGCHPYALRSISSASNDIEAKELNDSKDAEKEKEHQARLDAKDMERAHEMETKKPVETTDKPDKVK
jgi:hypothetical protein